MVIPSCFADQLLKYMYYKTLLLKELEFFASQTNKHIIDFFISIRYLLVLVLVRVLDMCSWHSLLITCKFPFSPLYGFKLIYPKIFTKSTNSSCLNCSRGNYLFTLASCMVTNGNILLWLCNHLVRMQNKSWFIYRKNKQKLWTH